MNITISDRLSALPGYIFAEIDRKASELKAAGVLVADFGAGDPTEPTPPVVRSAIKAAVDKYASSGYPSYVGSADFREAIAGWTKKRFGVTLDPQNEICASIGSKEAIFNFPEAFINPKDVVIVPNPGYPPYTRGTKFAEGEIYYVNLKEENGFLPDVGSIPKDVRQRAKIMWINYPNNPTAGIAPLSFLKEITEFGLKNGIIIASDEAYSENYYGDPPHSILEVSKEGIVAFQSLSKRSRMTGYRVGWLAGDSRVIGTMKKLKTNIDSGTPTFIQAAAAAALADEAHVDEFRELYRTKRDILVDAFTSIGLPECRPQASLYIWQKVPKGMTSYEFTARLLEPDIAIVATPGSAIAENTPNGNPGEGYIRFALVPTLEECKTAANRLNIIKSF